MSSATKPTCDEKMRLLQVYQAAAERYQLRLQELRERTATSPKEEFDRLRRAAEAARAESDRASSALQRHVENHGC